MTFETPSPSRNAPRSSPPCAGSDPNTPTLCGDWTTRDLAAHLVVRERRLDAAPGIMIPALADYTAQGAERRSPRRTTGTCCSTRSRPGPPTLSPFKLLDPAGERRRDVHPPRGRATRGERLGAARTRRRRHRGAGAAGPVDGADGAVEGPRPRVVAHTGGQDARHRRARPDRGGDRRTGRTADVRARVATRRG